MYQIELCCMTVDPWPQSFSEFLLQRCICSTTATYTVAFISFPYIGRGWCHVFVLPLFCSLRPCSRWHPGTSLRSLVHNGHRDELAKKKRRGTFELATVLLCLPVIKPKAADGKCLPGVQSCGFHLQWGIRLASHLQGFTTAVGAAATFLLEDVPLVKWNMKLKYIYI